MYEIDRARDRRWNWLFASTVAECWNQEATTKVNAVAHKNLFLEANAVSINSVRASARGKVHLIIMLGGHVVWKRLKKEEKWMERIQEEEEKAVFIQMTNFTANEKLLNIAKKGA